MSPSLLRLKRKKPRILNSPRCRIVVPAVFCLENPLVGPLVHKKFVRLPSLVPPPQSLVWLIVFASLSVLFAVLLVCLVFVIRHPGIRSRPKIHTGIALSLTFLLGLFWMYRTAGAPGEAVAQAALAQRKSPAGHWVNLTWIASSSKITGYNIYRSDISGSGYTKLNPSPVKEPTYLDSSVQAGKSYYYVVKAVDEKGVESAPTNETVA